MAFFTSNSLYLLTALAVGVAVFIAMRWPSLPFLRRLTALFFIGVVAHVWEETRFPGGFTELVTTKLGFTGADPHIGELFTAAVVLLVGFTPILLPRVAFLSVAAMFLGILEAIAHTAAIWLFKLNQFYSPGLVTALLVLLPVSILGISYAARQRLLRPAGWVLAFLYMIAPLLGAQRIVVSASGMPYSEFVKNIWAHF